ncbi:putative HTH-type transcriptional regulator [Planotetraspora thailandica]|uniref:Putative HTH-type transcriptional regulator n=1 Tax=Planotetraspora thailandica TaxID=487172 RepID=A0A8J3Y1H4_9ACTN|nr:AraC family transcriptional regulator [Planotetraspora thailandica]GII59014.1 putative HTH-type transcriptional regulator [Planotetraspora thailandica]
MDAISRLVRLAHLEGTLDTRCLFTGRTAVSHPDLPAGEVPFHLVLEGECSLELVDRTVQLVAGDIVLLSRGQAHTVHSGAGTEPGILRQNGAAFTTAQAVGSGDLLDLFCGHYTFRPGAGDILFATLPEVVHVNLGAQASEHARALTALMRYEADNEGHGTAVILSSLCDVLLAMALRHSPQRHPTDRAPWTAIDDMRIQTAIDALVHDPGHEWTIAELAEIAAMSRATFIRHFTRGTGMSVGVFLTKVRMMIAADLLTNTDQSIGSIAATVGFSSESSFGRVFRLTTATTPARFRRETARRRQSRGERPDDKLPGG